ncbi:MAG: AI-2E family transporter [Spirochaetales bacterium]|nr:AI-2E family transporter [Spirochaetales bacterium]
MDSDRFRGFNYAKANLFLVGLIVLMLVAAVLKLAQPVVLALVVSVLLAFVLEPLIAVFERLKVPRVLSIIIVFLLISVGLVVIGAILAGSISTIATLYPKYEERFTEIYQRVASVLSLPYDEHRSLFQNLWDQLGVRQKVQSWALSLSQSSAAFLGDTAMVLLLTVFLLLEIGHMRTRVETAFAGKMSGRIQAIIADVVKQVARYMSIKFLSSMVTGVLVGILLAIIGVDFAIVWGVLSFILNFIPAIGSVVAGGGVTLFALVQFYPDPGPIIGAFLVVTGVNMVIGNFVEPRVQGENLGLSPFVIILSLMAWGWLWGFAGMVLAVPMTVIVKIVCENVPILEPVSVMLGSFKAAKLKENPETPPSPDML